MLIDFFRNKQSRIQYVYDRGNNFLLFSSNNNLSFTKNSYLYGPQYQLEQKGGEDVYLCLAHISRGSRYCINQDVEVVHFPRTTLRKLFVQFYNYGGYFVSAVRLVDFRGFEFYYLGQDCENIFSFKRSWPIKVLVNFSSFHLFFLGIIGVSFGMTPLFKCCSILLLIPYLLDDLRMFSIGFPGGAKIMRAKFAVNLGLFLGSLIGSLKSFSLVVAPGVQRPEEKLLFIKASRKLSRHLALEYKERINEIENMEIYKKQLIALSPEHYILKYKKSFYLLKRNSFFYGFTIQSINKDLKKIILN